MKNTRGNTMIKLLFVIFILVALQSLLSVFQIINYKNTLKKFKGRGIIGVGIQKGKINPGQIVILVSSKSGEIITGEQMKGLTIFARFKSMEKIQGKNIFKLKEEISRNEPIDKQNVALLAAINNIEKSISDN